MPRVEHRRQIDRGRGSRRGHLRCGCGARDARWHGLPDRPLPRRAVRAARRDQRRTRRPLRPRQDRRDVANPGRRTHRSGDGREQPAAAVRAGCARLDQRNRGQRRPSGLHLQPDELHALRSGRLAHGLGRGGDRRRRRRNPLALPHRELLVAPVQTDDLTERRIELQPRRRDRDENQGDLGRGPVEHPPHAPRVPEHGPLATDHDPESVPGADLRSEPGDMPRRLRDRQCDRAHPRAEIAADRSRLPRLARRTNPSPTRSSCSRAKGSS